MLHDTFRLPVRGLPFAWETTFGRVVVSNFTVMLLVSVLINHICVGNLEPSEFPQHKELV
jgi:hypothetical protein